MLVNTRYVFRFMVATLGPGLLAMAGCSSHDSAEEFDSAAVAADNDSAALLSASFDAWKYRLSTRAREWRRIEPRTEVGSLPIAAVADTPGPTDDTLVIDYVFIPASSKPTNLVVMNSGIHGVEAPAGVLFQDVLLGECANRDFDRSETALLVIHVMNPFGAKYGRRFNFANVDLNRNFFDYQTSVERGFQGASVKNPEYDEVKHLLEGGRINLVDIYAAGLRHGEAKITKALSGQYSSPHGIYYGGSAVQPEGQAIQRLIAEHVAAFKNVAIIDVHTGLGKQGINQIMTNPVGAASNEVLEAHRREVDILRAMFPDSECKGLCELQLAAEPTTHGPGTHSFTTTGDFTQWIHEKYPDKRLSGTIISVTSEIGTTSGTKVLEALVDENYCYWNRSECGEEQYANDVSRLRELFNPANRAWKDQAVKAARQMCTAVGRFAAQR